MSNHPADSVRHRAIEFLADQAHLPFEQVARIYAHEQAELDRGATVKTFLPIFIFRNVQAQLLLPRPA